MDDIQFLTTSWQRARGAMFQQRLGARLLVFSYPHPAPRLFHTFFCPPLRLLALDEEWQPIFNRLVSPNRFVGLPPARIILEADPDHPLPPLHTLQAALQAQPKPQSGALIENSAFDRLLFAMLKDAIADMQRLYEANRRCRCLRPEVLRAKFTVWERGQLVASAGFILDRLLGHSLPRQVITLARQLLQVEGPFLDELSAAAVAGVPWKQDFPGRCCRCGRSASWRQVLMSAPEVPEEAAWRYQRPENAVPLCRKCAARTAWPQREGLRLDLAWGLWGRRFEAFWRWHRAAVEQRLPGDWDRQADPLWPRSFGGSTWETGSGALMHCDPRPPDEIVRTPVQRAALLAAGPAGRISQLPGPVSPPAYFNASAWVA